METAVETFGAEVVGEVLGTVSPAAALAAAATLPGLGEEIEFDPASGMADDPGYGVSDCAVRFHWAAEMLTRAVGGYMVGIDPVADQSIEAALADAERVEAALRAVMGLAKVEA